MDNWRDITIKINDVVDDSIVDGPGMRYTVFVQGCPHGCVGCHNPQTHDPEEGHFVTLGSLMDEIMENPLLSGVTFSGGEPFCQPEPLVIFARELKARGFDLVTFSGWTYEQLKKKGESVAAIRELLALTDMLVDGPFVEKDKDLLLLYRGSKNQRLVDLQAMRAAGDLDTVILCDDTY